MQLFWLFAIVPLVEIWVMIEVGAAIGAWLTIILILLTAVLGSIVMRRQGLAALADLQSSFAQLRDPTRPMAHGALILLGGLLLFVPGFVTDAMGALLLIPAVRAWLIRRVAGRMIAGRSGFQGPRQSGPGGRVIDVEFEVVSDPKSPSSPQPPRTDGGPRPPSGWTRG